MLQSTSSHSKKIMVVASGFPTVKYPMAGIFEWDQARALAATGNQIIFAAIDLRSIRRWRKWGISNYIQDGVQVYQISIPVGAFGKGILDIIGKQAFRILYKKIVKKHGRLDVVHAHFLDMAILASDICYQKKIPFVITEHTSCLNFPSLPKTVRHRAIKAYSRADKLLAVSNSFCENLLKSTGYEAHCLYNIVDTEIFKYINNKLNLDNEKFTFVSVGGLIHRKGFDLLIEAFSMLTQKHSDCELVIFGDGEERSPLSKLVDAHEISKHVVFMGASDRNQIALGYRGADAFVLASRLETFGVVYIEAMAAGLPVIATRCGGPEDFVTPETGILVPVDDKQALYEGMEFMLLHRNMYNSEFISKYASDHFSPLSIASQLDEIYNEVLRRRSK